MDPFTMMAIAAGIKILGSYAESNSKRNMLNLQADFYDQNAENALYEGRINSAKIARQGQFAQGQLTSNFGASGVDVNSSQTVDTAERTLQSGINQDVYTTMYNAASEARQQRVNAVMKRYESKQEKNQFIFGSLGSVFSLLGKK